MRRIVILGTSCSGKSTLARGIASKLGVVHIELDALHWGPNWTPHADFAHRVERAVAGEAWVLDGNYTRVRHLTWARADTLIWLDYPMRVVMLRALRRTISRAWDRTELWSGNRESFRLSFLDKDSILLWVINTWRLRRRDAPRELRGQKQAGKRIIRFRNPGEVDRWLSLAAASSRRSA